MWDRKFLFDKINLLIELKFPLKAWPIILTGPSDYWSPTVQTRIYCRIFENFRDFRLFFKHFSWDICGHLVSQFDSLNTEVLLKYGDSLFIVS